MTVEELHKMIMDMLPDMPRQISQAVRHIMDHPDEVLVHSMRDLASHAGVAPATLLRMSQTLGFKTWASPDQKYPLARNLEN